MLLISALLIISKEVEANFLFDTFDVWARSQVYIYKEAKFKGKERKQ